MYNISADGVVKSIFFSDVDLYLQHKKTKDNYFSSYGIFETHWRVSVHVFHLLDSFISLHSFLDDNEMFMETLHICRMSYA